MCIRDSILAVNVFGTFTVLIIAVLGFMSGRPDFLDIALVYALINFISTIAVLKFVRYGDMGWPRDVVDESRADGLSLIHIWTPGGRPDRPRRWPAHPGRPSSRLRALRRRHATRVGAPRETPRPVY